MSEQQTIQSEHRKNELSDSGRYFDDIFKEVEKYLSTEVLRHFPMAFYWMDKDGYLLGANEVELQFFGLHSLSQLIGKHVCDFGTIDAWKNCQRVMNGKTTEILEEKWIDPKGEKRTFLTIKSPLQGKGEEVIGLVGMSIDITPNKKAEEIVAHVKDNILQTIGQYVPINFYWMDKEGYVLGANDTELKNLGYSSIDNFVGKHASEVSNDPACWEVSKKIMEKGQPEVIEEIYKKPSGEETIYLSVKSPLLDVDKKVSGLIARLSH